MLTAVLWLLLGWNVACSVMLVVWVVRRRRIVLRWGPADLWMLLPYGLFIWAVASVLNCGLTEASQ